MSLYSSTETCIQHKKHITGLKHKQTYDMTAFLNRFKRKIYWLVTWCNWSNLIICTFIKSLLNTIQQSPTFQVYLYIFVVLLLLHHMLEMLHSQDGSQLKHSSSVKDLTMVGITWNRITILSMKCTINIKKSNSYKYHWPSSYSHGHWWVLYIRVLEYFLAYAMYLYHNLFTNRRHIWVNLLILTSKCHKLNLQAKIIMSKVLDNKNW